MNQVKIPLTTTQHLTHQIILALEINILQSLPIKSVRQNHTPNLEQLQMMEVFRQMVNHCIRIGLKYDRYTLKRLSSLAYPQLSKYQIQSKYKLTAISQACARLVQMKKNIKKGMIPRLPFVRKPYLVSCYGFKINKMLLSFPIRNREFTNVLLNNYTVRILSEPSLRVRSFSITPNSLSLSIQKMVMPMPTEQTIGIDRNLRNVTLGNEQKIIQVNTSELLKIKENYNYVKSTFKRNDHRIRKKITGRLGIRQARRIQQRIHKISKAIVEHAKKQKAVIVLENLQGIRKLYRRGNGQGNTYRRKLNSWSFYELQRQIQYKAEWQGIQTKYIDPKCTSTCCPRCGGRLQADRHRRRDLWCGNCERWRDRDIVAALNISHKGLVRFANPQGDTYEAMNRNLVSDLHQDPVILRVDVSKLKSGDFM